MHSSQRSIKRKRFDDEIVQYSIGAQSAQLARIRSRRQSQASSNPPQTSATSPASKTPEPITSTTATSTAAAATSQTGIVNTNSEPKISESVKSTESLNQHIVSLPSSPIPIKTASNATTTVSNAVNDEIAAAVSATTVSIAATTTAVTSIQQAIPNISTPVRSPTSNTTPMIPQTPSIQPSTTVPAAVGSPAPRKLYYKQSSHV